jgi:4-deoxy-L-threo-5-hexosulose-uronate ketol-isomerase
VYLYFDVATDAAVFHMMETRRKPGTRRAQRRSRPLAAVVMHCGAGTRNYSFVWAMGGENQEFTDMDQIAVKELK